MDTIVVDTSILANGEIVRLVQNGLLNDHRIIIPKAVLDELQSQASQKKQQGYAGLKEIKELRRIAGRSRIEISLEGGHPSLDDICLADNGRIDALITDVAKGSNAVLFTADRAQSLAAEAEGIPVQFHSPRKTSERPEFTKFFDETTMSVHLKEDMPPMAKRGLPGAFDLATIGEEQLSRDKLQRLADEIMESARAVDSGNVEIARPGATVVQHEDYRIAITQPPFSESFEITIVHPTVRLTLEDYKVSEKLMNRFANSAEGIIISGAPGSGKSTLASSLANFYHSKGKIVKTFESPRDLQVEPGITQYTKLDGSFENTADILLLVRPDYTVFDEVRRREDFEVYSDLRLTGVGMVGVVHANSPIDSIQRFVGKIELGMIPSVLDTVVFVERGQIIKVYSLELKVKVPSGMAEKDLARPVIEITNFETDKPEYEIYTFGEENVILPITEDQEKSPVARHAEERLRQMLSRFDQNVEVEVLTDASIRMRVDEQVVPRIIGKAGANIQQLEKELGLHIDVEALPKGSGGKRQDRGGRDRGGGREGGNGQGGVQFDYSESGSMIVLDLGRRHSGKRADLLVGGDRLASARIGRRGQIRIPLRSQDGKAISGLGSPKSEIEVVLRDS